MVVRTGTQVVTWAVDVLENNVRVCMRRHSAHHTNAGKPSRNNRSICSKH